MNLRSCSVNNPHGDIVDSEIIEEQTLHSQMSKKKKTPGFRYKEGQIIFFPPPTLDTLQLTEANQLVTQPELRPGHVNCRCSQTAYSLPLGVRKNLQQMYSACSFPASCFILAVLFWYPFGAVRIPRVPGVVGTLWCCLEHLKSDI